MFNLEMYADVLNSQVRLKQLSPKTRDYYIANLQKLEGICADQEGASAGILEKAIWQICKDSKQVPKYVAAIKKYERDVLGSPKLLLYGEPLMNLRTAKPLVTMGKRLSHSENTYSHKINALTNPKLKLAFRLQKQSGLRVEEIADLQKNDLIFLEDGSMLIKVKSGKGRKERQVHVMEDASLYENLQQLVTDKEDDQSKLFYSASYLKKKAGEYQMQTHDLRRINSRQRFREERDQGVSRHKARAVVAMELGHKDAQVTNLYLGEEWNGGTENEDG